MALAGATPALGTTVDDPLWRWPLRLRCTEPAGVLRRAEPVTAGIPLPRGLLLDPALVILREERGAALPVQATALSRWDDESVRWLLLDFAAEVPAGGAATYTLAPLAHALAVVAPPVPQPAACRRLTDEAGASSLALAGHGLLCRLGTLLAVELTPPASQYGAGAAEHLQPAPGSREQQSPAASILVIAQEAGGAPVAARLDPALAQPEAAGPLRAAAALRGYAGDEVELDLRVQTFASRPVVRLDLTVVNHRAMPLRLERLELAVRLPGVPSSLACVATPDRGHVATSVAGEPASAARLETLQLGPTAWGPPAAFQVRTEMGRESLVQAARLEAGWCAAATSQAHAVLAVRRFAPLHPKAVRAAVAEGAAELAAVMVPPNTGGLMLAPGMAATMEVLLQIEPASGGRLDLAAAATLACAFDAPLHACAEPSWVCATGVFGDLVPADRQRFPRFEQLAGDGLAALQRVRDERGEYGQLDYGDWAYDRYPQGWGNVEYDLPHALFLLYARSGERRFFDWAVESARHFRDVDVNHGGSLDLPAGAPHIHSTGHAGRGNDLGHTWLEGLLDWHCLTGDPRALAAARGIADFCTDVVTRTTFSRRSERAMGWMLICLTAMYRQTREARYLDACAPVIEQALAWQDPALGNWPNPIGECDRVPKCLGGKPFMVGIVLEGLRRYHQLTRDPRVGEAIVRAARWLVRDDVWVAADHGFVYATCHRFLGRGRTGEVRELDGLLYAYELSGEARLLQVAVDAWEACLQQVGAPHGLHLDGAPLDGKGFATLTRSTPHVLARLARLLPNRSW